MNELVKAVDAGLDELTTIKSGSDFFHSLPIDSDFVLNVRGFVRQLPAGLPAPTYVTLGDDDGNSICMEWISRVGSYLELKFGDEMYYFSFPMKYPEEGKFFNLAKASDLIRRYAESEEIDHDPFYGDGD